MEKMKNPSDTVEKKKSVLSSLLLQVSLGIAVGIAVGLMGDPKWVDTYMRPLGLAFVKVIRLLIAPIIFCTVVVGIARMRDMKKIGRVGLKAVIYFEIVTTLALFAGLLAVNLLQPGVGLNADSTKLDIGQIAKYTAKAKELNAIDFIINIVPSTLVNAFTQEGDMLQVLFIAILVGMSLAALGDRGKLVVLTLDELTYGFFRGIQYLMRLAPFGAGGSIAFAVSKFDSTTLASLGKLLLGVYVTSFLFMVIVVGFFCWIAGFSFWKLFSYIKEEFLIVMGTATSTVVLPRLLGKLENLGIQKSVVGLVTPAGYSLNLIGTSIYLPMAAVFIAQAFNINLTLGQQFTIVAVLMLTSKGAAAAAGGGFICLAATLSFLGVLPVSGLVLLLGVDWFMSMCRSLTNMVGNAAATVVVAEWEKSIDHKRFERVLNQDEEFDPDQLYDDSHKNRGLELVYSGMREKGTEDGVAFVTIADDKLVELYLRSNVIVKITSRHLPMDQVLESIKNGDIKTAKIERSKVNQGLVEPEMVRKVFPLISDHALNPHISPPFTLVRMLGLMTQFSSMGEEGKGAFEVMHSEIRKKFPEFILEKATIQKRMEECEASFGVQPDPRNEKRIPSDPHQILKWAFSTELSKDNVMGTLILYFLFWGKVCQPICQAVIKKDKVAKLQPGNSKIVPPAGMKVPAASEVYLYRMMGQLGHYKVIGQAGRAQRDPLFTADHFPSLVSGGDKSAEGMLEVSLCEEDLAKMGLQYGDAAIGILLPKSPVQPATGA